MSFLLVPHEVTSTTATVWVGAIDEDALSKSVSVEFSDGDDSSVIELDASEWKAWTSWEGPQARSSYPSWGWILAKIPPKIPPKARTLYYQRVEIKSLTPRTSYSLKLSANGQRVVGVEKYLREGRVTTLPVELPAEGEKPFTILLGSCFYGPNDPDGMVGATYHYLPEDERPDIKVLCGDQVYLDNPWRETTFRWYYSYRAHGSFRALLFKKYEDNWTQVLGNDAGFRQLLKDGANYLSSDDHEYWNNAPSIGGVGFVNTFTRTQRDWWFEVATDLFQAFQSPKPLNFIKVGRLSVCIADTRIHRDSKGTRFMKDEDLEAVEQWIDKLQGPGVLVIGQPVLARENSIRSFRDKGLLGGIKSFLEKGLLNSLKGLPSDIQASLFDKDLPDYRWQYDKLMTRIKKSAHSIVVLTGDVHFGRIAYGALKPGSESKFVEVISSPMRVVLTPTLAGLGLQDKPIFGDYVKPQTEIFSQLEDRKIAEHHDQFVTLEFSSAEGTKVNMKVKTWPILGPQDEVPPRPEEPFHIILP